MIRFLLIFLFFLKFAFAFEISYDEGRDEGADFSVLHLKNDVDFSCKYVDADSENYYECKIQGKTNFSLENKKFRDFDMFFEKKEKSIIIYIKPRLDSKMYSFNTLHTSEIVFANTQNKSRHYSFLFSKRLKYIKAQDGLNFNIIFNKLKTPSIGALDLNQNPLELPRTADVNSYLNIKEEYDKKNYDVVLRNARTALKKYKDSIFSSEFMLYKLRAMNELYTYTQDQERDDELLQEMIKDSKKWRFNHPSDIDFPEVMFYTMRAYIALGQRQNAKYSMEILRKEHPKNYFSQLAILDFVDYENALRHGLKDIQPYVDMFYDSENKDIASRAALTLAINYFLQKREKPALRFTGIVLDKNSAYLLKDKRRSIKLAQLLDKNKHYKLAAKAYELLFYSLSKSDKEYESTLKNLALGLVKAKDYKKADNYLRYYMQEFPKGSYMKLIKEALDRIFLESVPDDDTNLHKKYAELIAKYAGPMAFKALDKDVKLYYDEKNYPAVIAYKDKIEKFANPKLLELLKEAATKEIDISLQAQLCKHAIKTLSTFKEYKLSELINYKKQMLNCLLSTKNIELAKIQIAANYKDDKIFYALKTAELAMSDKDYELVKEEASKVLKLRILKDEKELKKAKELLFLAYLRTNEYNKAMKVMQALKNQPMDFALLELYEEFVRYANAHNMQSSILNYAPRAIDYQNYIGKNTFSPKLEFIYLDALKKAKDYKNALALLKDLVKLELKAADKARAFYSYAQLYLEDDNNIKKAKEELNNCLAIKETSDWQRLCKEKLDLLK